MVLSKNKASLPYSNMPPDAPGSLCTHVIQHRLKVAGQRWTAQGAQRMANLRVLRKSDRWDNVVELAKARKRAA